MKNRKKGFTRLLIAGIGLLFFSCGNNVNTPLILPTYKITYSLGEGVEGNVPEDKNIYLAGQTATLAASQERNGYTFKCWNDGKTDYSAYGSFVVYDNVTFTAQWKKNSEKSENVEKSEIKEEKTFIVTYYLGEEVLENPPTDTNKYKEGDNVVLASAPKRSNYRFEGWLINERIYEAGALYTIGNSNVIITARWIIDLDPISFTASEKFMINTRYKRNWDGILYYSTNLKEWKVWDKESKSISFDEDYQPENGKYIIYLRGEDNTRMSGSSLSLLYTTQFSFANSNNDKVYVECHGNIMSLLDYRRVSDLTEKCFRKLFSNSTITTAPELPATTLASACYQELFYGCTGLTSAPTLPATTLAEGCYDGMFSGCTGLTSAPALPATTLAKSCYQGMFSGCTGLTSAPALPATTLAESCYRSMFYGCIGLTSAPALPVTTLAELCYGYMFSGCTGLTSAPELPATTLANTCYGGMFSGCTGLTSAPELPATTLANACYLYMFSGCTGLTAAPDLPVTTLAIACYQEMFSGCTGLTSAPELPAITLADQCYAYMFQDCTGIISAPELNSTNLKRWCYAYMFSGCTNLTSASALPANTLIDSCYKEMYSGCTKLKVKTTSTGTVRKIVSIASTESSNAESMFTNCIIDGLISSATSFSGDYYLIAQ